MSTLVALSVRTVQRGPFLDPNGICYLEPNSARAFEAMNQAAIRELGIPIDVFEAGRTWARQNYLYQGWINKLPGFNLALPAGMSIHEKYEAVDYGGPWGIPGTREHNWLVARGPAFGWIWTGARFTHLEGWHFEQNGLVVAFTAAASITPITSTEKGSTVTLYYSTVPTPVPADYAVRALVAATIYALAGESPGTPANWLETQDTNLANGLAGFHSISQHAVHLEWPSYLDWKAKYLTPVLTKLAP